MPAPTWPIRRSSPRWRWRLNRLADVIDAEACSPRSASRSPTCRIGCAPRFTALRLDVEGLRRRCRPCPPARRGGGARGSPSTVRSASLVEGRSAGDSSTVGRRRGPPRPHGVLVGARMADQNRELTIDVPDAPALVHSLRDDLAAAVDALVGNIFAHTPAGTALRVSVVGDAGGVTVLVADDGAEPADDRATERGRSGRGSTGLGARHRATGGRGSSGARCTSSRRRARGRGWGRCGLGASGQPPCSLTSGTGCPAGHVTRTSDVRAPLSNRTRTRAGPLSSTSTR